MSLTGVSILQENLNYSPALIVTCQILPQILPQLQSYMYLLTRGKDASFDIFCDDFFGTVSAKCLLGRTGGCSPQKLKILKFEIGIVQFDEHF